MTRAARRPASDLGPLEAALAAIPGLKAAEEAYARALEGDGPEDAPLPQSEFERQRDAIAVATVLVRNGGLIPPGIADEVLLPAVRVQAGTVFRAIRAGVRDNLHGEIDRTFRRGVGEGFAILRQRLDALLDSVRMLAAPLHGVDSAASAIARGQEAQDAWSGLELHVLHYEQIREAQGQLVRRYVRSASRDDLDENLTSLVGYYRDSIDLVDEWLQRRHFQASRSIASTPAGSAYVAWLNDGPVAQFATTRIAPWFPTTNPAIHLIWLATEGQPWLPDLVGLVRAYTAARSALTAVDHIVGTEQYAARADYYATTRARDDHKSMQREINPLGPDHVTPRPDTLQNRLVSKSR